MLLRLTYTSTLRTTTGQSDIDDIVRSAWINNSEIKVTGLLLVSRLWFLQQLEGDRLTVTRLFRKISRDSRHSGIIITDVREIDQRRFGHWDMAAIDISASTDQLIDPRFAPHKDIAALVDAMRMQLASNASNLETLHPAVNTPPQS